MIERGLWCTSREGQVVHHTMGLTEELGRE